MNDPSPIPLPPTQDELPYDDGEPMETGRHRQQMELLIETLQPWLQARGDGYVAGNMFVYYSLAQVRRQDFKGPDVFVVLDVPQHERKSWVVWEEGKPPDVVIELLSESTAEADKTTKKRIYESRMRVAEYFWFDPFDSDDWAGFRLQGEHYEPLESGGDDRLPCRALGLTLTRWRGLYQGVEAVWLRWTDLDGMLLSTAEERTREAESRAEQAESRAEQAETRAQRLAARLRELGMDPDEMD